MNYYIVISYGLNQITLLFKLKAMREQNDDGKESSSVQKIKTQDPERDKDTEQFFSFSLR